MKGDANDPKALIREAYAIEGITAGECRSVFLDWALSVPMEQDTQVVLGLVLAQYEPRFPDHPMTRVLRDGLNSMAKPRRRGGWKSRVRPESGPGSLEG